MTNEFKGAKLFWYIPVETVGLDEDLLKYPKSILLMGEIIAMLNTTGRFYMSNKTIAKRFKISVRTVQNYLDLLEQKKLIKRKNVYAEDGKNILYREIYPGDTLMQAMSWGYSTVMQEAHAPGDRRLMHNAAPKESSVREEYKRTYNSSSSSSSSKKYPAELADSYLETMSIGGPEEGFKEEERQKLISWLSKLKKDRAKQAVNDAINHFKDGDPVAYLIIIVKNALKEGD